LLEEQVLVGLRLFEGLEVSPELRAFVGERAEAQVKAGLLIDEGERWRASDQGRLLLDALTFKLLT
jgi:coproporphyrinogen III oxidase-like Fe-S oxidoreductase